MRAISPHIRAQRGGGEGVQPHLFFVCFLGLINGMETRKKLSGRLKKTNMNELLAISTVIYSKIFFLMLFL